MFGFNKKPEKKQPTVMDVIAAFGLVAEEVNKPDSEYFRKYPESLLPYSKEVIQQSLQYAYDNTHKDVQQKEVYRTGLYMLTEFVPDAEFEADDENRKMREMLKLITASQTPDEKKKNAELHEHYASGEYRKGKDGSNDT